jgi:hypothetical protein
MKIHFILAILFFLFLSSCNFPLTPSNQAADEIAISVAVAKTKTALANENPVSMETLATPSINASITPSPSPSITPTSTDVSQSLGNPFWSNDLNNGSAFGLNAPITDDYTRFEISNGKMVLTSQTTTGGKGWRMTDRGLSDYYLEGTFITGTCSGSDQYGLVFRAPDYSSGNGYYYSVTCGGQYSLMIWDLDNAKTNIIGWNTSDAIVTGSNQTNKLGVWVKGSTIKLLVNGKPLQEINNATYNTATKLGAFVAGKETLYFQIGVDQINLWTLP